MATSIKISQLPAKGSNLEATDLLEVSEFNGTGYVSKSITGQEIIDSVPASVTAWGTITGTLSAQTDLNTALNGKQDDITLTTTGTSGASTFVANTLNVPTYSLSGLGGVPTSRTLTINGTTQDLSADRTFTISTGITIGTTAITSGTVGRVLFQGTGNVVSQSANLFFDVTNNFLGVGGTPVRRLDIISDGTNWISGVFAGSGGTPKVVIGNLSGVATIGGHNATLTAWSALAINSGGGNVLIGTTTDAGFKLDVNGTARVSGLLTTPLGINLSGWYLYANGTSNASLFGGSSWIFDVVGGGGYRLRTAGNVDRLRIESNGNVLINTTTDVASSKLTIESTTQGFLPPRMTTTQKNAIASPATGLMVYDTTLNLISVYNGTTWITL